MGLPPLTAGALKATLALVFPALAAPIVGAPGTVTGVTALVGAEGRPVPKALEAVTVKV